LRDVSFTDANNGTVVGVDLDSAIILRTTNGGTSWIRQASGTTNNLWGVSFTDMNNGTAVGDDGTILRTTNGGINWISQLSGLTVNETLYSVSFTDANNGTAVGVAGVIVRTTNGGTTWSAQYVQNGFLLGVSFSDVNNGTAVGQQGNILRTTDGGTTWTSQHIVETTTHLQSVSFTDANNGTAVGDLGTILRTTNGGATFVEEEVSNEIPMEFLLSQNYPNPFNPSTTIRYSVPQNTNVMIKVFDVLGNEVATLVNEEKATGSYEANFNAKGLSSGIYFYKLQAGSFIETKKMILLK